MAETTESVHPSGASSDLLSEKESHSITDSSVPADPSQQYVASAFAAVNAPAQSGESPLSPIDKSMPLPDAIQPTADISASVPGATSNHASTGATGAEHTAAVPATSNSVLEDPTASYPPGSSFTSPSNGTYQYSQQPVQQQQQTHGMYPNTQGASAPMSPPAAQATDNHTVQTQPGQVPQAPIGSPLPTNMPSMSSMSQYMQSYPSNPMGLGSNMHYQLGGDPNKMLSGSRHKKEVKRRTKTGCLTCRKRRIKVRT